MELKNVINSFSSGDYVSAEKNALNFLHTNPDNIQCLKILSALKIKNKEFNESIKLNLKIIDLNKADKETYNNIAIAYQNIKNYDQSIKFFLMAIDLDHNFVAANYNIGNLYLNLGLINKADIYLSKTINLNPKHFLAITNLSIVKIKFEKLDEALDLLNKSISINPDYFNSYHNLGIIYHRLGNKDKSLQNYYLSLKHNSNHAPTHFNLATLLESISQRKEAEKHYKLAIKINPNYINPYLNLCELLDRLHRLNEVIEISDIGIKKFEKNKDDFLYFKALSLYRKDQLTEFENVVSKINDKNLSNKRIPAFLNLKANYLDKIGSYDQAYSFYKKMNNFTKSSKDYIKNNEYRYLNIQEKNLEKLKHYNHSKYVSNFLSNIENNIVFLIGFPRSGTTLVDNIINSHSKISVIEERPILDQTIKFSNFNLNQSNNLKSSNEVREYYLNEVSKYITVNNSCYIVDKLPLNILNLPFIANFFPDSKIILALRHPLDCILSCWMQNFKLNPAMSVMCDLDETAKLYDICMETYYQSTLNYHLDIKTLKYEKLINDFNFNIKNLLDFLNLEWESNIENYREFTLKRGIIRTPSYSQVVKPIYTSSSYRWINYKIFMESPKKIVNKWISYFEYTE